MAATDTSASSAGTSTCRFFENEFPEVDECVTVRVESIAEMGAYVRLLEYGDKEGMVLLSELSRRRIRSINKLIRVGTNEVVMAVRVDKEKGYIDLSKRRVSSEERAIEEERFTKAKAVQSILMHVAEKLGKSLQDLCERISWPLDAKYPSAYEAFTLAVQNPEEVFAGLDMTPEEQKVVLKQIERRLTPSAVKMRADVEVSCLAYEGVDAVREALIAGKEAVADSDAPVAISLVAPPLYALSNVHMSRDVGFAALEKCIEAIRDSVGKYKGRVTIKEAPYALAADDDKKPEAHSESDSDSQDED